MPPGGRSAAAPLDCRRWRRLILPTQQRGRRPRSRRWIGADAGSKRRRLHAAAASTQRCSCRSIASAVATLPPSASAQDEYDMAYGYALHKDYSLAEQSFPRLPEGNIPTSVWVPEAQYWLGESLFQQQRYRDAAESFLGVSTRFERYRQGA